MALRTFTERCADGFSREHCVRPPKEVRRAFSVTVAGSPLPPAGEGRSRRS